MDKPKHSEIFIGSLFFILVLFLFAGIVLQIKTIVKNHSEIKALESREHLLFEVEGTQVIDGSRLRIIRHIETGQRYVWDWRTGFYLLK